MLLVFLGVLRVYGNVVQVHYNGDIEHVQKDIVDKTLESCWSIGKTERHNQPFEGAIVSMECGFPFIAFRDTD